MPVKAALFVPIFLVSAVLAVPLSAQTAGSVRPFGSSAFLCNYTGGPVSPDVICASTSAPSNVHAERVVDRILKPIGLMRNFKIMECGNTSNCFATVIKGQRFIIYDAAFMESIEETTETDWSAISIMAHEIGHHLQGHTIDGRGGQPLKEIEADKFSGFVLHQLGASLEEASVAVRALGNTYATPTHPAKPARIEAIRKGWMEAEAMYPKNRTAIKTPTEMAPKPIATNNAPAAASRATVSRPVVAPTASALAGRSGTRATVGCISGDCEDGTGVFVYPTRERYAGEFEESDKHGEGVEYYADGKIKYKGNFRDNLRSDYGVYYYRNGDKYAGWFQKNVPNGKGTYYFADGDKIVGTFKNGQPVQ